MSQGMSNPPLPRRSVFSDQLLQFRNFAFSDGAEFSRRGTWADYFRTRIGPAYTGEIVLDVGCHEGELLSAVSAQNPTTAFIGLQLINSCLPTFAMHRPVFYRERASYLYDSTAHGLASILIEVPWLALMVMCVIPIIYYMVGFNSDSAAFWFYAFVSWVFCLVFVSIAQVVAAVMPSVNVAQAVVGLVIPILFLFGGL